MKEPPLGLTEAALEFLCQELSEADQGDVFKIDSHAHAETHVHASAYAHAHTYMHTHRHTSTDAQTHARV